MFNKIFFKKRAWVYAKIYEGQRTTRRVGMGSVCLFTVWIPGMNAGCQAQQEAHLPAEPPHRPP